MASPVFEDCVPHAIPTLKAEHAARAFYVCLYVWLIGQEMPKPDMQKALNEAALVARERMDRDHMPTLDCTSDDIRQFTFVYGCDSGRDRAPECIGFGAAAHQEALSIDAEAEKRLSR